MVLKSTTNSECNLVNCSIQAMANHLTINPSKNYFLSKATTQLASVVIVCHLSAMNGRISQLDCGA